MLELSTLEALKTIRNSPRKMHKSYLISVGYYDLIEQLVPYENFKIKEKLDVILHNHTNICHCGKLSKYNSKYCSLTCRNKDPDIRKSISHKNKKNKVSRSIVMKQTLLEKYGVNSIQNIPSVQAKTKEKKQKTYLKWRKKTFEKYNLDWDLFNNVEYLEQIGKNISLYELSKKYFNGMPITTIQRYFEYKNVNIVFPVASSIGEREIAEFVESNNIIVNRNVRYLIDSRELDIYVPEYNFAIEFHGLYYHKNKETLHLEKYQKCKELNIQLFQIFEDEWYNKQDIIKSMILNKLGKSSKIYARKCKIQTVSYNESKEFLNNNHIQGHINGANFGLYYNEQLVSIITVGKCRYYKGMEILRFCNIKNTTVIGGFSKLLKYVKNTLKITELYTYADLRYSTGKTYEKFGKYIKTTNPGYYWCHTRKTERISRYKTQKHKLKDFLKDSFDENFTETQNLENAGYNKIWDCGHNLYIV